ncbi:YncE family protein [Patiriisocius sp. Uisw_017]|jgi:hypothetical protein|uniref:YncE family protein n=1 Tax=Patiriisocius sp. Uisw_017 TaxID=3230968 RepID=UPI0039EC307C
MKKLIFKPAGLLLFILVFTVSCTSDDREEVVQELPPSGAYTEGMFILNEGGFGSSNATVSFLDSDREVYGSIFSGVNNRGLGDVAQSMGFYGERAYIAVNNSSTIEVVNRNTFESIATTTAMIVNPRYIEFSGNKGYITNWGDPNDVSDDYVAVLNLATNLVETKIPVPEGPEKILFHNEKLYVAHKGGYGYGNTITVIDVITQLVTSTIAVADVPSGMVITNGSLYVLCSGKAPFTQDETVAELFKINTATNTIEASLTFPIGVHPSFLELNNNILYYTIEGAVFAAAINDFQLPTSPLFQPSSNGLEILYGFKVTNSTIYIADAKDYASNGEVFIYNINGALQQQFSVAIIPNSFYFNN